MSGLDERQRRALAQIVSTARTTLFGDAERTLRGTYGILPDGTIQAEEGLAPDPGLRLRRRTLEAIVEYLRADRASTRGAVERLTREVAFTHLNRLLAIRVADALGVIAPSLRDGPDSVGFRQWIADLAPLLATADETGGYWTYLSQCADELAVDAPALFDPRNPLLALRPTKPAFETVVGLLADPSTAELWEADDTFGWTYQFFNTKDERQQMRAESAAPRDSRELAVRNQFFTPAYVVRFLVHNTLGRRLVDADPSTALLDQLDLLVDPPTTKGKPLELDQVKVLDPACGSGHFLLGCYDVLEAAWALRGVEPVDAAKRIVPCLWGVDIDPRTVQVAQAAIILRARRACGRAPLPPPNIICARGLPEDPIAWAYAQSGLGEDLRRLVGAMRSALDDAPVLGPLLKAEERLAKEIRATVAGADDTGDDLFATAGIAHDNFGNSERAVIAALQRAADSTTASPADRLLAAGAADAVKFVEAVRNRYDAVLMNPPFGEPVPETKEYLKAAYPWIPTRDYNLLAAFVGRGLELCKPDGYLGAITSRTGMFLKTFERWRTEVLLDNELVAVADLGSRVMEDALVEAAMYVVRQRGTKPRGAATFLRLLRDSDRPAALSSVVNAVRGGLPDTRVFNVPTQDFAAIPGSPMAYWMSSAIRRLFTDLPRLEGTAGEARVGVQTGDDFRFIRLFWEVNPRRIAQTRDETNHGKRWVPFAKGGEYSPYWSDIHLVVNWERDGGVVREFAGSVVRNPQYYFRAGLTWPERTTSGFGPRVLPGGGAFSHVGYGCFPYSEPFAMLAYLNSRLVRALMDFLTTAGEGTSSGTAARHYLVGLVQALPWPSFREVATELTRLTESVVQRVRQGDEVDETARDFLEPWVSVDATKIEELVVALADRRWNHVETQLETISRIEELLEGVLAANDDVISDLDAEVLPVPTRYVSAPLDAASRHELQQLAELPIDSLVDEVVSRSGGHRELATKSYFADRRIELLSHFVKRRPHVVREVLTASGGLLETGVGEALASSLISHLVGVVFGRWDARGPRRRPTSDPFASVPLCPPAMLVSDDGFPTTEVAPDYPLPIPPDGILLDEPGHTLDLVAAIEAAARVTIVNGEDLLADAVSVLGRRSLRDYLAKAFFKVHLGSYSKSRRQAPVYWQLTIPSGAWSAWLYAPRFSREMLYAVVTLADHRLALTTERIRALQEQEAGSARQRQKALDEERTLAVELQELRDGVGRLAGLGWHPNLDDGYVLCAAPLAQWFPKNTWRQLGDQLAAIREGTYSWASIHEFRDVL